MDVSFVKDVKDGIEFTTDKRGNRSVGNEI